MAIRIVHEKDKTIKRNSKRQNLLKKNESLKKLTGDKRQRRDSMWFLETESPTNAIFFPRTISKNALGSNLGSSHLSGFHLQLRKSLSILPFLKQFLEFGIVAQLELVYSKDPLSSGTH